MSIKADLPRQNSDLSGGSPPTREWYNFFRRLRDDVNKASSSQTVTGGNTTNIFQTALPEPTIVDATTARTLTSGDANSVIEFTNGAAITVTVATNASEGIPTDSTIYLLQGGAGQVTVSPAAGVTIDYSDSLKTRTQESMIGLKQIQPDKWELFGDAEPVAPARSALIRSANSVGAPAFVSPTADGQVLKRSSGTLVFGALTAAETTFTPYSTLAATNVQDAIEELLDEGTSVDLTDVATDVKLTTVGTGLYLSEGTNATMGVATLAAGSRVVSTTKVTANSRIFVSIQSLGTVSTPKAIGVTARTAGTSFTLTSADATDTSVIAWMIVEPADVYPVALLHFNGTDASTTFTDESGKTWTASGNAQIDTAQSKFGGASGLFDGTSDFITSPTSADFTFGTGDFTIEFFLRANNYTSSPVLYDGRPVTEGNQVVLYIPSGTGKVNFYMNGSSRIVGTTTITSGVWRHIALCRASGNTKLFIDGVQEGSTFADSTNYTDTRAIIGADRGGITNGLDGWIDELRITKGYAHYTSSFTAPTSEFTYP